MNTTKKRGFLEEISDYQTGNDNKSHRIEQSDWDDVYNSLEYSEQDDDWSGVLGALGYEDTHLLGYLQSSYPDFANDEQEYDSEDDESSQSSQDKYPDSQDEQPLQEDQTQDPDPDQTQDPLFVLLNEIENNRPKKTRQNFTLKTKSTNRKKSTTNFTMKNREPISSNTLDADHSPQQAAEE